MAKSKMAWKREQERRKRERKMRDRRRAICAVVVLLLAVIAVIVIVASKGCSSDKATKSPAVSSTETVASEAPSFAPYKSSIDIKDVDTSFFDDSAFMGNSVADTIAMYDLLQNTDFYSSPVLTVDNVYTTIVGYGNTAAADQLKSKKFSKVFLSFGEREMAANDVNEFARSYSSLVEKVKSYQTNAQIYLIGIPPVDKAASDEARYGMSLDNIKKYNKKIISIAKDQKVYYVNSVSALGSGSYLYNGVSADGINLNRDCCIELLKYITDNAYIPESSSSSPSSDKEKTTQKPANNNDDEEEDEEGSRSSAVREEPTDTPAPTVNVLKDSAKVKNGD